MKKTLTKAHMARIGAKGGKATSKAYGPDYFRELAGKRKNRKGGRPRKRKARKVA